MNTELRSPRGPFGLPMRSKARIGAAVDAEIEFHLGMLASELEARGWSRADAETEARRRFGDIDYTRAYCAQEDLKHQQERDRMARVDELGKDIRYTLRSLRGAPGFTLIVLLTLALGIGANTAIFSVVRAVLLDPLPFANPDRVVRVWHANASIGLLQGAVSEPDFLDWKRESKLAESMGAVFYMDGLSNLDLTGDGRPARLSSALVGEGFFETLGTAPLYGRTINSEDQLAGRNRVAVLGHGIWKSRFNGDPQIIGKALQLNGESFTVIGVMPQAFGYPGNDNMDVWIPLSYFGPDHIGRSRGAHFLRVLARLKPGVSEAQLHDELSGIAARLSRESADNPGWEAVTVKSIRESLVGDVQRPLSLLLGAVFLVLLITCANVASLLLARATSRQRELAVRAALGAGRNRIIRQLLTESLVLAVAGGALGVLLALWAVQAVATTASVDIPRASSMRIDGPVLAFAFGISLVAGVLFGVVPTMRATGTSLERALRSGGRGNIGSAGGRLRNGLVVAQVALAVVLVTAAALTTKSFARLLSVNLGFNTSHALYLETSIPDRYNTDTTRKAHYQATLAALQQLPGVVAVGSVRDLPMNGNGEQTRPNIVGQPAPKAGEGPTAQLHQVSADYFRAMDVPLKAGRFFDERDRTGAPLVVIVNEEFAKRNFPGVDPTTQRLTLGNTEIPIVGVVGNIRQLGPAEEVEPSIYLHAMQNMRSRMSIVIRTTGDPLALANSARQAVWSVDPEQTIGRVASLEQMLGRAVSRPRLLASLFAMFGLLGLSLGALGVYGVLAFNVSQRQQEIGVRVALGASPASVQGMIVKQGLLLAGAGVLLGVLGSASLTGAMQAVLYDIGALDLVTFVEVVIGVVITALVASWVPARRATSIDPAIALRNE